MKWRVAVRPSGNRILLRGDAIMLSLVALARQTTVIFASHAKLVLTGLAAAQALVSLMTLLERVRTRQQGVQQKLAGRLASALRGGIL